MHGYDYSLFRRELCMKLLQSHTGGHQKCNKKKKAPVLYFCMRRHAPPSELPTGEMTTGELPTGELPTRAIETATDQSKLFTQSNEN